jgi:hypothetical protein
MRCALICGKYSEGTSTCRGSNMVRELRRRKPDIASLAYFDAALSERHGKRAPAIGARRLEAATDFDKVSDVSPTGVWSRYAGPEPGMLGCRAPRSSSQNTASTRKAEKAPQDRMSETTKIAACSRCLELFAGRGRLGIAMGPAQGESHERTDLSCRSHRSF